MSDPAFLFRLSNAKESSVQTNKEQSNKEHANNQPKKILIAIFILLVGLVFLDQKLSLRDVWSPGGGKTGADCMKVRVALDMGSGATRFRSALIDTCVQKIIEPLAYIKVPLDFIGEGSLETPEGRQLKPEFMMKAESVIIDSLNQLKKQTMENLKEKAPSLQSSLQGRFFEEKDIEVAAVATASLRKVSNAESFINKLSERGIALTVIPQEEEGHLAFAGVQSVLGHSSKDPVKLNEIVVWDIGGGSSQIVAYEGNLKDAHDENGAKGAPSAWKDYDSSLAAVSVKNFIAKAFKHFSDEKDEYKKQSPNPLIPEITPAIIHEVNSEKPQQPKGQGEALKKLQELEQMMDNYTREQMAELLQQTWWHSRREHFYGIGGVHGGILSALKKLKGDSGLQGYTIKDLEELEAQVLPLNDEKITEQLGVPAPYTGTFGTNILLVKSLMKELGLQWLQVLDVDNTQGTLISSKFWRP